MSALTAERVARNEAIFREANDGIEAAARSHTLAAAPFICECADERCVALITLTLLEYEQIRADPRHFFTAAGHQAAAGGWETVVAEHDHYLVVEKVGEAAGIATNLDGRRRPTG